jgi:hypothetical protein
MLLQALVVSIQCELEWSLRYRITFIVETPLIVHLVASVEPRWFGQIKKLRVQIHRYRTQVPYGGNIVIGPKSSII